MSLTKITPAIIVFTNYGQDPLHHLSLREHKFLSKLSPSGPKGKGSKKREVLKKVLKGTYSQESKKPWDSSDGILAMNVVFF